MEVFTPHEPHTHNPVVFTKGHVLDAESLLEIMMEGEKEDCAVDDVNSFIFIFNTEYASKLRDTLTFIENSLMQGCPVLLLEIDCTKKIHFLTFSSKSVGGKCTARHCIL